LLSNSTCAATARHDESVVSSELTFKGSMSGALEVPLEGMEAGVEVALSFDTESKSFHVTVMLKISVPPVELDLQVGFSVNTGCDAVNGDFLYGGITITLTEKNEISGSVRGAKHCDSHPQVMHALGATPPRISPKHDAIADFLAGHLKNVVSSRYNKPFKTRNSMLPRIINAEAYLSKPFKPSLRHLRYPTLPYHT